MAEATTMGVSATEMASYYARRFASFESEAEQQVQRVAEYRRAIEEHHSRLHNLEALRGEVGRLQRRLAEVEIQSMRERLREFLLAAENQEFSLRYNHYRADVERLLAPGGAAGGAAAVAVPVNSTGGADMAVASDIVVPTSSAGSSSRCVVRVVVAPDAAEAGTDDVTGSCAATDLWDRIGKTVHAHIKEIEAFDGARAARVGEQDQAIGDSRKELFELLSGLASERMRLASAITGYVQLRVKHSSLQRTYGAETEGLKAANLKVAQRTEVVAQRTRRETKESADAARKEIGEALEYRQRVEVVERGCANALEDCLGEMREETATREIVILREIQGLREKCAAHRRRRKLTLSGLKADLSLLDKKLTMLQEIADEVHEEILFMARPQHCDCCGESCVECGRCGPRPASSGPPLRRGVPNGRWLLENELSVPPSAVGRRRRNGHGVSGRQSLLGAGRARSMAADLRNGAGWEDGMLS